MKKYSKILSLLLVLSILISPFTGILSDIAMAEGEELTGPEADLRRAADILEVTIQNTDNKLTSPVTDDKWITLVDYDKGGDTSIYISWESSNEDLIEIDEDMGYITLPEEGEEEVRLTATLCKGEYKFEKHFDYVLTKNKPEESEDEKYLSNAIKSLEWFKVNLNSDEDKNVNVYMKDVLRNKGFEGIDVSVKSSNKQEYIDLDGNINYIFDEEYLKQGLPYDRQVALTFQFSKGEAKKDFSIRTMVGWDRDKVRDAIEKNIIEPMSKNLVGENEGFDKIKQGFEVPTNIEYTTISWESSDNNILKVEPSTAPLSPSNIKVIRASEDKEVDLICKVKFNRDDDIELEKKYTLTVLAFGNEDDTKKEMQKLLDENYTVEKLKDFTNKQPIDANDVKNDIQLLTPRNTGIKDYFNYEFKVTSDNDSVVINTYRANVYRPLPGEEAKIVNLTVQMRHKEKDITVSKVIPIKVTALSQKEIDDEIQLMELVKENYFQGIKGDNSKSTEITSDLRPFREANLIDGELVWTRHIDDDRNTGIYPDEIEGSENQEQWRLFRSSNPQIIKHENLIVSKPEYTTDVKIESTLSSKLYGKYAERYPDREDFQKLYRQNVSATVTVIGEKSGEDITEPDKKTLEVNTAIIVFNKDGNYEIKSKPQKVTINKDEHDGGLTAFGSLQATTSEYKGDGWITSIYGITGPSTGGWMFTVNGKVPNVGANQVKLKEGDKVIWFCTYDWKRDKAPQWSELTDEEPEEKLTIKITTNQKSIKVGEELPLVAEVRQGDKVLTDKEVQWLSSNAEIATIDENNNLIARKVGEVTITAALVEDKNINDTIKIEVVEKDKEDLTVEEVIKSLREYYSNKDEFKFRPALGYNYTSDNLEIDLVEISTKFKTNEEPKSASDHIGNIIGLIAAGKDPYNYNNKNYVEILVKSQNKEGKFIIGQYDDYPTTVAFSMLALDMADANYNRDKAIEALLGYQESNGSFGGVDETGMVLTALAKYKDKSKVQDAINKGLKYLKEQQDENTGGFVVWGGENPYSASAVLQGLISVGENPQSEKWTKGGKTIIDSLMNFYKDGHFEKESEWSDEPEVDMVTEQAFIALADVYRGKSIFNEIKLNTNKVVKITIDVPEIDKIIEGEIIKLYVTGYDNENNIVPVKEIEWTSSDDKVAEVDSSGRVITKKSGKVTIEAKVKGTEIKDSIDLELAAGFLVPEIGDYYIKAFLWEDLKLQNIIMHEAKEIKVAN